jgi:hypothetical protein
MNAAASAFHVSVSFVTVDEMLGSQPDIPWAQIARMRDHLAHRYFDTAHTVLQATVDNDLPELERAVHALVDTLRAEEQQEEGPPNPPKYPSG